MITSTDEWIVNQSDAHLEQMSRDLVRDLGKMPLPAACTVTQLMHRQNCEAILEMVLLEKARRMVGRMMKETQAHA
jgi:hypothetical protein